MTQPIKTTPLTLRHPGKQICAKAARDTDDGADCLGLRAVYRL